MTNKRYVSWDELQQNTMELYYQVIRSELFRPDVIVGVSRGGLLPATMLSHMFKTPLIPLHWTTRDFHHRERDVADDIRLLIETAHQRVLVVDDISDTGKTFASIQEYIFPDVTSELREYLDFASIHIRHSTLFKPRSYVEEILDDTWIVYPYEIDKPII